MASFALETGTASERDGGRLEHRPIVVDGNGAADPKEHFRHYRFGRDDIAAMPRIVGKRTNALAELMPLLERLHDKPAGAFEDVVLLHSALGLKPASGPSRHAINLLLDFFIDSVNRRLQEVYRGYLRADPLPKSTRHDRKIASLEATRNEAEAIVNACDWHWLANWLQLHRNGEDAETCLQRLSNFAFRIQRVNFRFTYHCNIACRHCYNSSGPKQKAQRIPLAPMLAIVGEMPGAGIGHLNLTGGEPFLYPDHVKALVAAGRTAGLRGISIYSNGYWAIDEQRANRMLEDLSAVGFMRGAGDHLKISTGAYHQEFVAFERILILARSYHAMFGRRLLVDFEMAPGTAVENEVRERTNAAGLGPDRIDLFFRHVSPLGRGKGLSGIPTRPIELPCNAINQIVFDPDGGVRPCCGLNNENQGVIVGRLASDRLLDLVKRMQNDPVLQFLAEKPMDAIFGHVKAAKSAAGYSDKCHLCQNAVGDLTDKEKLQAELFDGQMLYPFWFTLSLPGRDAPHAENDRSGEND
ncbi:MAG: radical SAM protein [Rhizomicrobium sp.]